MVTLFNAGECETLKRSYHAAMGGLFIGAALWNLVAFAHRRTPQLAVNVLLYTALVAFELRACDRHRKDCVR